MPANVTVKDNRWQFIAGNKYWVIGTINFTSTYVTGGVPLAFNTDPEIKASRPPWFSDIPSTPTNSFVVDPVNGLIKIYSAGTEVTNGADISTTPPATGLFIFQGME